MKKTKTKDYKWSIKTKELPEKDREVICVLEDEEIIKINKEKVLTYDEKYSNFVEQYFGKTHPKKVKTFNKIVGLTRGVIARWAITKVYVS